jgi:hypothetical protein
MTWQYTPHTQQPRKPVRNEEDPVFVVPNGRGGYALRLAATTTLIGTFSTPDAAARFARSHFTTVRILTAAVAVTEQAVITPISTKANALIHS